MDVLQTDKSDNFAALLKDVPMGCKGTVLSESILRNCNVNCLTFDRNRLQPYNDNLCLLRALVLLLHGNKKLTEETSKLFNLVLDNSEEGVVSIFQGVHLKDFRKIDDSLQLSIFIYDIGFVDGKQIGELCRRKIQKYERVSLFYDTTITSATSTTSTPCSKLSGVLRVTHFSRKGGFWNGIWLLILIVLSIFTHRMFTN